jgi:uncharacterized protein (DUF427 family)
MGKGLLGGILTSSTTGRKRKSLLQKGGFHAKSHLEWDDEGHVVEGNYYFPPQSIKRELFNPSTTHTTCPWKGEASYYDIIVGGKVNKDSAWYYPSPKEAAKQITGHVAFWKGVQVDDH